jgi:hypothetical protein
MDEKESVVGRLPPPRKEDVLFRPDAHWVTNACITHRGDQAWVYGNGFRSAAQRLALQVCDAPSEQDFLIYPIVYLYRHHIELALKQTLTGASALLDRELSKDDNKALQGHGLSELWQVVRPLLDAVCEAVDNPVFPAKDLEGIDSYVRQLHEHDPDGQRFRYATTKIRNSAGNRVNGPSLDSELKLINIGVFAEAMEKLADYLQGIDIWFAGLLETQAEMERDAYDC